MNCDTCSHFDICKYKDKINKESIKLGFNKNDVFELNIKCKYYKEKENPMLGIKIATYKG